MISFTIRVLADYISRLSGIHFWQEDVMIWGNIVELHPGSCDINIQQLQRLSDCLFTEKININVGYSGTRGYSEYTPGSPGSKGYIECFDVDWDKVEAAWRNGK